MAAKLAIVAAVGLRRPVRLLESARVQVQVTRAAADVPVSFSQEITPLLTKDSIGVGREGFQWSGLVRVSRKAEWPDWRPPPEMIAAAMGNGGSASNVQPGIDFFSQLKKSGNFIPVQTTPATVASGQTPISIDWDYNNFAYVKEFPSANWKVR